MSKLKNDKEFLYAELDDSDLPYNIYKKREFYYNRVPQRGKMKTYDDVQKYRESVCKLGDFQPREQQTILPNFINPNSPYKGIILMHGTGSGKSCTAIAIAEQFKEQIIKYNTKIYVLVPGPVTRENFKKELLTCTGDTYLQNKNDFLQMTKNEIDNEYRTAINSALQYYKILSYKTFYKKVLGEKIQEKKIVNQIKLKASYIKTEDGEYQREIVVNRIHNMNNSILIVDEAHNLTDNEYGDALKKIIKVSHNLRVILLTATPMINLPDEIVALLNFIRPQDDIIERDKIFSGERNYKMTLKPDGLKYLAEKARGYISFYRGNIPYTFAKRIEKGVVPKGLLFTPVVKCFMDNFQYNRYHETTVNTNDTLDSNSRASGNFVFPVLDSTNSKLIGHSSIEGVNILISQINEQHDKLLATINKTLYDNKLSDDELNGFININEKKNITGNILKLKYIKKFSIKFYKILNRLAKNVIGKKGPVTSFIYSNLVKAGGIELFAETLIQNGYLEYMADGNYDLRDDTKDYKTGLMYGEYIKKNDINNFKPATFLLVTGGNEEGDEMPEVKQKIIKDVFNNPENMDGQYIKFILGSKVMNEGVTLMNCAQVHILDAFYNIPKAEQVIGRAIRMCVHQASINDDNKFPKVYVYRYVVSLINELSVDEILYQKAEIKYLIIKEIERLLKEVAFDCPLLLHANMFPEELEKYKDCEPYKKDMKNPENMCPALCDFRKCDLKCSSTKLNSEFWDSRKQNYKDVDNKNIDYSTFNDNLVKYEINLIKNKIKDLYQFKYVYLYSEILKIIKNSFLEHQSELFNNYFLDQALEDLMLKTENDFNNFKDIVYDKFNRQGYLIQRNKYYIFQPFNENENLPAYYRDNNIITLKNNISLDNYVKNKFSDVKVTELKKTDKKNNSNKYDFDSVLDYYNNREEYNVVGIIDMNTNKLASAEQDLFKLRPKINKTNSKKRATGVYNFKGAVCFNSKSKSELLSIISKLPNTDKSEIKTYENKSREAICDIIKDKMIHLEKYTVSGDKKITYIMVPYNHPIYPFPLNLEDRVKYTITKLNNIVGRSADVLVKKHKNKDDTLYYELILDNDKYLDNYKTQIESMGFQLEKNVWKYLIV
jgi:superfamily II DNA or RNA helicase